MYRLGNLLAIGGILLMASRAVIADPEFRNFGPMMQHAGNGRIVCGPVADGSVVMVYMLFNNAKGSWFMVALDTRDGSSKQYLAPGEDICVTSGCLDAQGRLYAGTQEGHLYRFDPKLPEQGLVNLGMPAEGEGYLFNLTQGPDGRIYMGSYPGGRLLAFDPASGQTRDYGQAQESQLYTQQVAVDTHGYAYADAGVKGHQIVRYDLESGQRTRIDTSDAFGDDDGPHNLFLGVDDRLYCYAHRVKKYGIIQGERVVLLDMAHERVAKEFGRLTIPELTLQYDFDKKVISYIRPSGEQGQWPIQYEGAVSPLFVISDVQGTIYGSSMLPLRMFSFDLATRQTVDHGNPFPTAGGEVYLIHQFDRQRVYAAAYGDADLILIDPTRPWDTGDSVKAKAEGTNPLSLGLIGDQQNRTYAMLTGPDGMVYLANTPDYGTTGGSLVKLDPASNTWRVFRNIIQDHSITSLSRVPGSDVLIAGGSGSLASGYEPGAFGPAELFLWDTSSDQIVYRTTLPVADTQYILQLRDTCDGLLLGIGGKDYKQPSLFVFDPQSRQFLANRNVSELFRYVPEGSNLTALVDGRHLLVTEGKIFSIRVVDRGRDIEIDTVATYHGACKGAVLASDPGDHDRPAMFFITGTDLVAMYLDTLPR